MNFTYSAVESSHTEMERIGFWRNTLAWIRVRKQKFEKKLFDGLEMSGRQEPAVFYVQKTWIIDFYVKSSIDWLVFWRKKIDYLIRKHFSFISVL